jgi:hypothetical protein
MVYIKETGVNGKCLMIIVSILIQQEAKMNLNFAAILANLKKQSLADSVQPVVINGQLK